VHQRSRPRRCASDARDRRRACSRRRSSPAAQAKHRTAATGKRGTRHRTRLPTLLRHLERGACGFRAELHAPLAAAASALSLWLRPLPCPLSSLDSAAESMREVGTRCDRRQNLAAVVPGYRSSLVASAAAQQRTAAESERRRDASQQPQEPESRRGRRSLNHLEERSEELLPAGADPPQHQQLTVGAALPHPSLSRPRAGFLLERQPEYGCAARTFLIASSLAARCES